MSFDSIAQARKIEILTFALTLCRYVDQRQQIHLKKFNTEFSNHVLD